MSVIERQKTNSVNKFFVSTLMFILGPKLIKSRQIKAKKPGFVWPYLFQLRPIQSTKALSTTKVSGRLLDPSLSPNPSKSVLMSFNIPMEPQIIARSVSGFIVETLRSFHNLPDCIKSVILPVFGDGLRVVVLYRRNAGAYSPTKGSSFKSCLSSSP